MHAQTLNVSRLIDERPIGTLQITVVILCALINFFDGIDTQSIGVAAPFIARSLGLTIPQLGPVFSAGLLGAAVGAVAFGTIADKVGRKSLLILASLLIGVFTLLTAFATSFNTLILWRFLAGIGLGGATPCFISLTAEYIPKRKRATFVTLMWSSFPLGAMVGAFVNSRLIEHLGWQAIFYIGGVIPLIIAIFLAIWLPESLKFLIVSRNDEEAARRVLRRIGVPEVGRDTRLVADGDAKVRTSFGAVFDGGRTLGTLLLWVPFFTGFGILTVVVLWTPALLGLNGISPANGAFVVAFNGLGAFIGQAIAGRSLERLGVVKTMVPAFALGSLATIGLGYSVASVPAAALCIGLVGLFLGVGTAGAIALAAELYPTTIRGTGVGLSMAVGRFGQVCGPLLVGQLLGLGVLSSQIMIYAGGAALVGGVFIMLFKLWLTQYKSSASLKTGASS